MKLLFSTDIIMGGVRARIIYQSGVSGTACLCNAKKK